MTWLIAGLGNPGTRYSLTRHNVGFWAIDTISAKWAIPLSNKSFHALWGRGHVGRIPVILSKPQTLMNRSGISVRAFMDAFEIDSSNLIVIHDDMDLPLAGLRIKAQGGSAGHRGVESIIGTLGTTEFVRIRIGIGRPTPEADSVDFVLGECAPSEREALFQVLQDMDRMIEAIVKEGPLSAMNTFNR